MSHVFVPDVMELTVGGGPDGDSGRWAGPLLSERAQTEGVLLVLTQAVYGHRFPMGVCHRHVEQVYM